MKSYSIFVSGKGNYTIKADEMVVDRDNKLVILMKEGVIVGAIALDQVTCILES